ncbi:MAG: anti-sigma factor antagonist [Clostridia bacterium]|nr:anti-sigma factor antagonist [Clostridia bacterium]
MIIKKGCNFESEYEDGTLRVSLIGEIDHHSAVSVRTAIDEKIYSLRPRKMIMDLSKIDFMDSSGLGLIMGRYALIGKLGGDFCISEPSDRVMRVFELSGLGRIIKIEKSGK